MCNTGQLKSSDITCYIGSFPWSLSLAIYYTIDIKYVHFENKLFQGQNYPVSNEVVKNKVN